MGKKLNFFVYLQIAGDQENGERDPGCERDLSRHVRPHAQAPRHDGMGVVANRRRAPTQETWTLVFGSSSVSLRWAFGRVFPFRPFFLHDFSRRALSTVSAQKLFFTSGLPFFSHLQFLLLVRRSSVVINRGGWEGLILLLRAPFLFGGLDVSWKVEEKKATQR